MKKQSFAVLSFIRWLRRKKESLWKQQWIKEEISLIVRDITYTTQNQPIFKLQWTSNNHVLEKSFEELLEQEQLLRSLSFIELKKIIAVKIAAATTIPFRLVAHFNENNKEKIVYKNKNNQTFIKNIGEIRQKEFIKQFSAGDAYLLGYLLAYEDQRQESFAQNSSWTKEH